MDDNSPEWIITDADVQEGCEEIIWCLMIYGGLAESTARRMLEDSKICAPERLATQMARGLFMHEYPYYWAMHLLYHEQNPYWWNTIPGLWPPPEEYLGPDWDDMVLRVRAKGASTGSTSE